MPTPTTKAARVETLASQDINARRMMTDRDAERAFLADLKWLPTDLGADLISDVVPAGRALETHPQTAPMRTP